MLFNETVLITGVRANGRRVYAADLPCRIVDNGLPNGMDGIHTSTNKREIAVFMKKSEWAATSVGLPHIGDIVTTGENVRFAVRTVNDLGADIITLGASQC